MVFQSQFPRSRPKAAHLPAERPFPAVARKAGVAWIAAAGLALLAALMPQARAQTADIRIGDARIAEGNSGTSTVDVPVNRTGAGDDNIALIYRTRDSGMPSATAGADYLGFETRAGLLAAGQYALSLPIGIVGDTTFEADELFGVELLSAHNAGPTPRFAEQRQFGTNALPFSGAIADVNNDGLPDLVVSTLVRNGGPRNLRVLLNTTDLSATTPTLGSAQTIGPGDSASLSTADFNSDGRPDIVGENMGAGGVIVQINATMPGSNVASFAEQQFFTMSAATRSVVALDLDGDGRPDLASIAALQFGNVPPLLSVRLNTTAPGAPSASFGEPLNLTMTDNPVSSVTAADLNGDGKADLVLADVVRHTVTVLVNSTVTGSGSVNFAAPAVFPVGQAPESVVVLDVNADGRPDVATANTAAGNVSVLLNTAAPGANTLSFATAQNLVTGFVPSALVVVDLNADGRPDLAAANSNRNNVSPLLNTTAPGATVVSFAAQAPLASGIFPRNALAADLNGDGRPELIAITRLTENVSVFTNTTVSGSSSAAFSSGQPFEVDRFPTDVHSTDINGDGRLDVVVTAIGQGQLSVLLNTMAPGTAVPEFAARQTFNVPAARWITSTDINGDGRPDLALASRGNVVVLINTTTVGSSTVSFSEPVSFPFVFQSLGTAIAVADVNKDGRPDVVVGAEFGGVGVLLNTTPLGSTLASLAPAYIAMSSSSPVTSVAVADVNLDGLPDLQIGGNLSNLLTVLINSTIPGATTVSYAPVQTFVVSDDPFDSTRSVLATHVNGDGVPDLVVGGYGGFTTLINETAPGSAVASFAISTTTRFHSFAVAADLNGDARPDIATAQISNVVGVFLNQTSPNATTPNFSLSPALTAPPSTVAVAASDLNRDGRADLVAVSSQANSVSVFLNQMYPVAVSGSQASVTIVNDDAVPDSTPDAISFASVNGVARGSTQTSASATVSGINVSAPISVSSGSLYSIGCTESGFTDVAGTIGNGQTVCVRHTAASAFGTDTVTTLAIGDVSATFTSTTEARDITPEAFRFDSIIGVVEPGSTQRSGAITVSGVNDSTPFSVTGGAASTNGLPCDPLLGATSGTVSNGTQITVCHIAGSFGSINTTTLTLGADGVLMGTSASFSSTTRDAVVVPGPFTFGSITGVERGSQPTSTTITITGIEAAVSVSVDIGEVSINGGAFGSGGSIEPGQTVQVRHTASASFAGTVTSTVTIGRVQGSFSSTTRDAVVVPNAFTFNSNANAERGSTQTSNVVTIAGLEASATVTVSNGQVSINGGAFGSGGSIEPGQTVQVRHTASDSFAGTVTSTVTIGGVQGTFSSTTRAAVVVPNAFSFAINANAERGSTQTSNVVTIAGLEAAATVTVSNGTVSINGGAFSSGGTIEPGQTVQVRHTASSSFAGTVTSTVTIGGVQSTFSSTTRDAVVVPNAFTFNSNTNVERGSVQTSNLVTITGLEAAATVTVSNGQVSINGGAFGSGGTIEPGQTVQVRHTASDSFAGTVTSMVTIGGVQGTFSSTTAAEVRRPVLALDSTDLQFDRGLVLRFRDITLNTRSAPEVVTLTNTGNAPLTISRISTTGDFRHTTTCGTTVAPGANCTISIVFRPTQVGSRTGETRIVSDAASSPDLIRLSGTAKGLVAGIRTSVASVDLGTVKLGSSRSNNTLTITSSGTGPLEIRSVVAGGDYSSSHNCPRLLDAGKRCTVTTRFRPTVKGPRPGNLTITTSAPGMPTVVALTGNGS